MKRACVPERSIRVIKSGKNGIVSYIFYLRLVVIVKCSNVSDDKITACVQQISLLGVTYTMKNRKILSNETFVIQSFV